MTEKSHSIPFWASAIAVYLGAAAVFSIALGSRTVVSEEMRWAEIAREMVATGDYWNPTINGKTYFDKPVGSYWLIVAASRFTGRVDEFTARLPSALFGLFGVGLVIALGRRIYGIRVGIFAGAILATSFGFAFYTRRATADIETVTGVLAAIWWFARNFENSSSRWVVPLWLGMAVVSLMKGLLGFALPVVVFASFGLTTAWVERAWPFDIREFIRLIGNANRWLFNRWTLLAVPLAIAVYLIPFAMADRGAGVGLDMVWRENVKRFVSPHNHTGPVYLYLGAIFILAAPWSLFLPAALIPNRKSSSRERFIRVAFWSLFLFFTASASRRSYYLLPILPFASLLIAQLLTRERSELRPLAIQLRRFAWWLFSAGVVLSGLALLPPHWLLPHPYSEFPPLPARGWLAAIWGLGLVAIIRSLILGKTVSLTVVFIGIFAAFVFSFGVAYPSFDSLRPRSNFLDVVRTHTQSNPQQLAVFHASDIVFDLGRLVSEFENEQLLSEAIAMKRVRWIVVPRRYIRHDDHQKIVKEESTLPWESADRRENKLVLLEVIPP